MKNVITREKTSKTGKQSSHCIRTCRVPAFYTFLCMPRKCDIFYATPAGIHRALVNFYGESKVLFVNWWRNDVFPNYASPRSRHTRESAQTLSPYIFHFSSSAYISVPIILFLSLFAVADPLSLLTLTRTFNNRASLSICRF